MLYDISNQDAQSSWDTAMDNPDFHKVGEGSNKRVAVHGVPTIEGVRSKAFQREVGHSSDLGSQGLMDTALARLDFAAQCVDMGRDFGGVMGEAFRPGSALGSSSVMGGDGGQTGVMLTADQISAMPLRMSAPSPSTPAPPPADLKPMNMSPRAARIGGLCLMFRLLMSRSADFGLDVDARVDTLIGLWHVLA